MSDLDLAEVVDNGTYTVYVDECGPLSYEMLNKAFRAITENTPKWDYYSYANWGGFCYSKSVSEEIIMNQNIGQKVRIIKDNSGRGKGIGLVGTVVSSFQNYNTRLIEYSVQMHNGEIWYASPNELEPYYGEEVAEKSLYINQIAADLAKIK